MAVEGSTIESCSTATAARSIGIPRVRVRGADRSEKAERVDRGPRVAPVPLDRSAGATTDLVGLHVLALGDIEARDDHPVERVVAVYIAIEVPAGDDDPVPVGSRDEGDVSCRDEYAAPLSGRDRDVGREEGRLVG